MPAEELVGPADVGPVAHGGHCVVRDQGRVIFVRHALPGERVMIKITDRSHDRYWRGDAVQILDPGPGRVQPPCPIAGPGRCGGCDFQHADPATQRELKRAVVAEQLLRLADLDWTGEVEPAGGDPDGLGWRSRMRYHAGPDQDSADDSFGLRAHRSDRVIMLPADGCRIAAPSIAVPPRVPEGADSIIGVAAAGGTVWASEHHPAGTVLERAGDREFTVGVDGFWQAHPAAPRLLSEAVITGLAPRRGESAFDLYCGVGLFAAALVDHGCGPVTGVEGSKPAVASARRNLADVGRRARFVAGSVERVLERPKARGGLPDQVDLVVLDPPRVGAGRRVVAAVARRQPRAIAYVACDPAALARDLAYFGDRGYRPVSLRAFDLFPMTHHVECVAILEPAPAD
ncbi:class I SAM-dependent RNA methyltransferase [Microlunatus speluncae]|uniref:class I SAM-dependent RNA methyltransferase n=1 Tax=Microlunatus speluncae TaxID=2594267 RepID=UPI0012663331|nr:TRAM domain-containing protein [Microlunatus speluncae]